MSGPMHRFRAMHRWWLFTGAMTVLMMSQIAEELFITDWTIWAGLVITGLILWLPATVLIVLIPRLRGLVAFVFALLGLARFDIISLDLAGYETVVLIGVASASLFLLGRIKARADLVGEIHVDLPRAAVAEITAVRPRTGSWQRIVSRIEPHPDAPDRLRAFTAPPLERHLPFFDVEILTPSTLSGIRWRAIGDGKLWDGSTCEMVLEDADGGTRVRYRETSRAPVLAILLMWFDCGGQDAMNELKFYAETRANWTIRAGDGRWWPTWSQPPEAAVF